MKRITSIVLLLFFLVGNSYAGINVHYCGGELQSVSMVTKAKACGMCGMETTDNGCCKDVHKLIKADDFSKVVTTLNVKAFFTSLIPVAYPNFLVSLYRDVQCVDFVFVKRDVPKLRTPIFIRICALII